MIDPVAAFYTDNDVALSVVDLLTAAGHLAVCARELRLEGASDDEQLLVAAQQIRTFVTHNERDFVLLHDAWQRWTRAWEITVEHSGILILPQGTRYGALWDAERITRAILDCVARCPPIGNQLLRWKQGNWQRRSGREWLACS